ncbi:MAG TPA: protein kinase [Streptosporangiaceae bacterium]|nr:protein kinase [Streptosporangiaceae bacterium]
MPQPTHESLRRWDPERIGPFTLLGRLGSGAMGQVYLGKSQAGRRVAVKTIKIELAEEPGFRDHFAHEVAAARRVSGLFTAAVVAADPEADMPWLATAYVPAPSLSRLVRACGPQPIETIWWLAAGCAEALESIHNVGLVHRDLKPSNVLVAPDGPRVIDFGVARAAERIQLTVTRGAVGTPAYMAPEQARDTRQASAASDVFALGATLLFAATGHAPYQGETVMDVLVRLATEPPDLGGLPAGLTEIVTACLARSPRDRPTSAALLARLGPLLDTAAAQGPHSHLTGPAMALIAEFERSPQFEPGASSPGERSEASLTGVVRTGRAGEVSQFGSDPGQASDPSQAGADSSTFASQTALPGLVPPGAEPGVGGRGGAGQSRSDDGAGSRRPWHRRRAPREAVPTRPPHPATFGLAGRATAAVLLIGAGAVIGAVANHSGSTPAQTATQHFTPPPNPPPSLPPSAFPSTAPGGPPAVNMMQPMGDVGTEFVVHGTGWGWGSHVSVRLTGPGVDKVSPVRPAVDGAGTFNYLINQDHEFFAGTLPAGVYHITVTGPGGARARAQFRVVPPPPSGGPGSASPGSGGSASGGSGPGGSQS